MINLTEWQEIKNPLFIEVGLNMIVIVLLDYSFTAAIPGNTFPSKYSNIAPPPVDT